MVGSFMAVLGKLELWVPVCFLSLMASISSFIMMSLSLCSLSCLSRSWVMISCLLQYSSGVSSWKFTVCAWCSGPGAGGRCTWPGLCIGGSLPGTVWKPWLMRLLGPCTVFSPMSVVASAAVFSGLSLRSSISSSFDSTDSIHVLRSSLVASSAANSVLCSPKMEKASSKRVSYWYRSSSSWRQLTLALVSILLVLLVSLPKLGWLTTASTAVMRDCCLLLLFFSFWRIAGPCDILLADVKLEHPD